MKLHIRAVWHGPEVAGYRFRTGVPGLGHQLPLYGHVRVETVLMRDSWGREGGRRPTYRCVQVDGHEEPFRRVDRPLYGALLMRVAALFE